MSDLPIVMTEAGPIPQAPATLRQQLVTLVSATNPGFTSDLPGTLIEDIVSTDVGALTLADQAAVDLVNSITPFGANAFLLNQLGQVYGTPLAAASNTSVNEVFSGSVNFVIPPGFTVSDGSFQYIVQDGGVIGSDGNSEPLFCLASQSGTWAVPANTVNQLVTSVPADIELSCINPLAGTPGLPQEDETAYRAQVLQAGRAASQGMASYLKTLLYNVPGVQQRLVSVRQQPQSVGGGWEVIVGGGDQYQVANAIFQGLFDISTLQGSVMNVTAITQANPGVVTTQLNHGLTTGTVALINGIVGMTELNNEPLTVTVLTEKTFSVGVDTTSFFAYISGGVVQPNPRNVSVAINSYPDVYFIPFVLPPQQTVEIIATWNTTATNFVAAGAIAQAAAPALVDYVNSVPVGQPMNEYEMIAVFQQATASILPNSLLTRLVFTVSINGQGVSPDAGTGIFAGDPESYFFATDASVQVAQG